MIPFLLIASTMYWHIKLKTALAEQDRLADSFYKAIRWRDFKERDSLSAPFPVELYNKMLEAENKTSRLEAQTLILFISALISLPIYVLGWLP